MRLLILCAFISQSFLAIGQGLGLGTTNPHASAALDITSTTGGVLIPRMSLAQRDAIPSPAKGLIIYVTNDSSLHYFDGTWKRLIPETETWKLKGNSGVTGLQYIGTNDATPFRVKMHNQFSGLIDSARQNSSWGYRSLSSVTSGIGNTAFGFRALQENTDGWGNLASGSSALEKNSTGALNTAVGLISQWRTTTGSRNTSLGAESLYANKTGDHNTAIGSSALWSSTIGSYNTAVGMGTMLYVTNGNSNTVIGANATTNDNAINSVAVGANAFSDENNKIVLGDTNITKVQSTGLFLGKGYQSSLTNDQILSIANPIEGTIIYSSTAKKPVYFDGSLWRYLNETPLSVSVGDSFGGGIVFSVDATGQNGLIAATEDLASCQWYANIHELPSAYSLTDGAANTTKIINFYGATGTYAAKACRDYRGGGFSDWYLPARDQLMLLNQQQAVVGNFQTGIYWASTEWGTWHVFGQGFPDGGNVLMGISNVLNVRPIRSF